MVATAESRLVDNLFGEILAPTSNLRASEWAREHFRLSSEVASAEGAWIPTPYQAQMLDVFAVEDGPEFVVVQKSARIGYTTVVLAFMAYAISYRRRHVIVYQPNDADAKNFTKDSVDPMIRDVKPLNKMHSLIVDKRGQDTYSLKMLGGKTLRVVGAVSPARFRRITGDVCILDESDGYPDDVGGEGDAVTLSHRAIRNSPFKRHVSGSTPTMLSSSLVARDVAKSTMVFRFWMPCPHCGVHQALEWEHMKWDKGNRKVRRMVDVERRARSVRYVGWCCGAEWTQREMVRAQDQGYWRTDEEKETKVHYWIDTTAGQPKLRDNRGLQVDWPRRIAMKIWAGYSPWYPWSAMVHDWLTSQGDVAALKTFTNLTLGKPWEDEDVVVDATELTEHRELLGVVPNRCRAVIAAVDVQDGWLSCLVVGFGPGEETWLLERREFRADVVRWDSPGWDDLREWLRSGPTWEREDGSRLGLAGVVLDSGFLADTVYKVRFTLPHRRVAVTKGSGGWDRPVVKSPPSRATTREGRTLPLHIIGTDMAKLVVTKRLMTGQVHISDQIPQAACEELAAEALVTKRKAGREVKVWEQNQKRNEALDCLVMALVGIRLMNPPWLAEKVGTETGDPEPSGVTEEPVGPDVSVSRAAHEARPSRQPQRSPGRSRRPGRGGRVPIR